MTNEKYPRMGIWQDKSPNTLTNNTVLKDGLKDDKITTHYDIRVDVEDIYLDSEDIVVSLKQPESQNVSVPNYRFPKTILSLIKNVINDLENE